MNEQRVYDNYEISGCRRSNEDEKDDRQYVEPCDEADAQFWTLYGHIDGQGVEAIGDFSCREAAELTFYRITGEPFAGSYEASPRLKRMHAADSLLAACRMVVERWEKGDLAEAARACGDAIALATAECPPWISGELDIHALLARRRQIAAIWSIEDVREIRPDLHEEQAWEVLRAVDRYQDASFGIDWDVLASHAEMLYGWPPKPTRIRRHS